MPEWYSNPHIVVAIVFVIVGFYALIKGADIMVGAAVAIAKRTGLSTAVIGATVVAFGTSLPELVVSITSMIQADRTGNSGAADIALSNVVGSNVFNIGLILGLSACIRNLPVPSSSLHLDYPLMIVASIALILMSIPWGGGDGFITPIEGSLLVLGLIVFMIAAVKMGKVDSDEVGDVEITGLGMPAAILLIIAGIALMAVGGDVALTGPSQSRRPWV